MEKRTAKILSLYNFYICILGPGRVKGGKKESASASATVPRSKKGKLSKDSMEKRTTKILSFFFHTIRLYSAYSAYLSYSSVLWHVHVFFMISFPLKLEYFRCTAYATAFHVHLLKLLIDGFELLQKYLVITHRTPGRRLSFTLAINYYSRCWHKLSQLVFKIASQVGL